LEEPFVAASSELTLFTALSSVLEQALHLQHMIQGAATNKRGEATRSRIPNPAKIPITCARWQMTEALECPSLPWHSPES